MRRLEDANSELRKKIAQRKASGEGRSPETQAKPRTLKPKSRRKTAAAFMRVGAGAEKEDDFQPKVAALLRDEGKPFKKALAATNLQLINDYGEPVSIANPEHHNDISGEGCSTA